MIKSKKNKRRILIFITITIAVILFLSIFVFPSLKSLLSVERTYSPAATINIPHELNAQVYLNDTLNDNVFSKLLISKIENAEKTIDAAVYSVNSLNIRDALYQAAERGVKVSLVLDFKKENQHLQVFTDMPDNFKIYTVNKKEDAIYVSEEDIIDISNVDPYMHNKFAIIDRGLDGESLFTGAWNWTFIQEAIDPTFVIDTNEKEIINAHFEEFERLKNGQTGVLKFKDQNFKPFYRELKFTDCFLEIWFSPGKDFNSIRQRMLNIISQANNNIKIIAWTITDKGILDHLIAKANEGVDIKIITDDYTIKAEHSIFPELVDAINSGSIKNIEVISDEKRVIGDQFSLYNSFLHQHTLIADDNIVMIGTNNWGYRGSFKNDENTLVTDNKYIISEFLKSFEYNYSILK